MGASLCDIITSVRLANTLRTRVSVCMSKYYAECFACVPILSASGSIISALVRLPVISRMSIPGSSLRLSLQLASLKDTECQNDPDINSGEPTCALKAILNTIQDAHKRRLAVDMLKYLGVGLERILKNCYHKTDDLMSVF